MEKQILENHGYRYIQSYDVKKPINRENYLEKVIQFYGTWDDLYIVYSLFESYGLKVSESRRVISKEDIFRDNDSVNGEELGKIFVSPVNEIVICY